jgi:hypothetical protein
MNSLLLLTLIVAGDPTVPRQDVVVVVGASGSAEFGEQFKAWSERWEEAASKGNSKFQRIGFGDEKPEDRQLLKQTLADVAAESPEPLWLVLIGHGTFDGKQAKFNLRGPDVTQKKLKAWLDPIKRPTVVVNCASSSSPFINELSAPNRIVVTATKSGYEQNFARFGDHISAAIIDPTSDLDKDEQVSLLEAFLAASSRVTDFYKQESRLATEHALLDDNGDGLGTPADWFRGVRATRTAKDGASADGLRANQLHLVRSEREDSLTVDARKQRDRVEKEIENLRQTKRDLTEDDYFKRLEDLLLELATLYADAEQSPPGKDDTTLE